MEIHMSLRPLLLLLAAPCAFAQNSLHMASPDGRITLQLSVFLPPEPGSFLRIGYEVSFQGQPLLDTSYLGFLIHNQEPLLGENLGLTASKNGKGEGYNWILGEYLQNGSLGRRINVEARVFDEGVAFRYIIPRTSPLEDIVIEQEETEFRFAHDVTLPMYSNPPLRVEQPGVGLVEITEAPRTGYPNMLLDRSDPRTVKVALGGTQDRWPVESTTPLTTSWRVLAIARNASELNASKILMSLK
jgi:alpha-glucosidase